MTTKQIVLAQKWKEQAVAELEAWAKVQTVPTPDVRRLADYSAGVDAGWRVCIEVLVLHGWIKDKAV